MSTYALRKSGERIVEDITWYDLKDTYLNTVNGNRRSFAIAKNYEIMHAYYSRISANTTKANWTGATVEQMVTWLHKGYSVASIVLEPPITPLRPRRRLQFQEEGEFQYDLALSGFDYPFLDWTERKSMGGMRVEIEIGFRAEVPSAVTSAYFSFVLKSIIAIETAGVDLEVWLTSRASFISKNWTTNIQVKKENEQSDYRMWSPMLSPGAHRHLIFLARHIAADRNKMTGSSGMGGSQHPGPFAVKFNPDNHTLLFQCPSYGPNSKSFPEAEMTKQLHEAMRIARRASL